MKKIIIKKKEKEKKIHIFRVRRSVIEFGVDLSEDLAEDVHDLEVIEVLLDGIIINFEIFINDSVSHFLNFDSKLVHFVGCYCLLLVAC